MSSIGVPVRGMRPCLTCKGVGRVAHPVADGEVLTCPVCKGVRIVPLDQHIMNYVADEAEVIAARDAALARVLDERSTKPDSPCEFTSRDLDRLMDHVRQRHIASTCGPDGRVITMRDTVWAELSPDVVQELIVTYLRNKAEDPS